MENKLSFNELPDAVGELLIKVSKIETLLTKPAEPPRPQRFDLNGALAYLNKSGYIISKSQFQKKSATGAIPSRKFNARHVFERSQLDEWVQNQCEPAGHGDMALTLTRSSNRKTRRCK